MAQPKTAPGGSAELAPIQIAVQSERVRTLFRQIAPVLITNVLNACIVAGVLWNSARKTWLVAWVTSMSIVAVARVGLARHYHLTAPQAPEASRWGRWFVIGSGATGLLWGTAGYALLAGATDPSQLVVLFVIAGMCAAAAGTIASHLPAFAAFMLPALTGAALRMIQFGDSAHTMIAVMIVIYGLGLTAVARATNRVLTEAFTLRFENERLIGELTVVQERLADTNRTLERRVAERTETLRAQSARLRNAERMEAVGRLAGGVAHDFNNLLTVILANLGELIHRRPSKHESAVALNEIREAANKGADLVRQLLMFSRRQRTIPQTFDLNEILRTMQNVLSRTLGDGCSLQLNLNASELPVRIDLAQVKQVVANLVKNARDAMTSGGVVTISTQSLDLAESRGALESGKYAVLAVADTGSGMDFETQQLIFDPFFTTKDVDKGSGLGLATVYGIVQQCGGDVQVTSEVDHGSTFEIYLPQVLNGTGSAESDPTLRNVSDTAPARSRTSATILLVEDEPIVRKVAKRILCREGYRVLTADSAEHALRLSAGHRDRIDVLVTDMIMPGMNGAQLAEHLRTARPGLRTLFISGYSRDLAIPADDSIQGTKFLAKPFGNESLVAHVKELLARSALDMHTSAA